MHCIAVVHFVTSHNKMNKMNKMNEWRCAWRPVKLEGRHALARRQVVDDASARARRDALKLATPLRRLQLQPISKFTSSFLVAIFIFHDTKSIRVAVRWLAPKFSRSPCGTTINQMNYTY
jgi:hypothetical protein